MPHETSDGKNGGLLKGNSHAEGGINAVVTDSNRPVELESGEIVINKEASQKHCQQLSEINQSAGDGVAIPCEKINNMEKGGETDYFKEKLGAKHISEETIITDKRTNISSKVVSFSEEGVTLKPISSIIPTTDFFLSYDALRDMFEKGEITISGYEHTDSDNTNLYLITERMKNGGSIQYRYAKGELAPAYATVLDELRMIGSDLYKHKFKDEKKFRKAWETLGDVYFNNVRQLNEEFEKGGNIWLGGGFKKGGNIYAKGGKVCPVGTTTQTLIFSKDKFSKQEAKDWAKDNGYDYGKVDEKSNSYRLRQEKPSSFRKNSLRTIKFTEGVKAVIGCPNKK